jgi:hypothetical protein
MRTRKLKEGQGNHSVTDVLPDVLSLFEEIAATLPADVARLEQEMQRDGEVYVRLVPRNAKAAVLGARGGGQLRYEIVAGRGSIFEVLPGARDYPGFGSAEEVVRAISEAVFKGNFEESVWTVGGRLAKIVGRVHLPGGPYTVRIIHGFYPLRIKKKEHFNYAPYA